jgi:hypothetical protein
MRRLGRLADFFPQNSRDVKNCFYWTTLFGASRPRTTAKTKYRGPSPFDCAQGQDDGVFVEDAMVQFSLEGAGEPLLVFDGEFAVSISPL